VNTLAAINRFVGLFPDTFRQFSRGRIWLPLLVYFALVWLVLYAHYQHLSPVFHGLIEAWTGLVSPRRAVGFSHYPGHFLMLPFFFDWARLAVGLLFEGVALGAAALMFSDRFLDVEKADRSSFRLILPSWIHLVVGWVVLNGLMLAAMILLTSWLEGWLAGSPRRTMAFEFALMPGIYIGLLALFLFVIPAVAVYGETVVQAIKRSLGIFRRHPITCLALAAVILAGPLAVSFVAGRPVMIVEKFNPELVYRILLAGLVIDLIAGFVWMGTAVRFLVDEED